MEQLAAPGSITLSASTLRLVEGLVQVNVGGPVPVKGRTEPVEVYELTGASTIRRRLQVAVARGLTKFVGRDTEIEALNQARKQAEAGHGQVVAAVGEAGVGKSRLVYEFIHSHRTQGWRVLESASVSSDGKATPYFPVIDLLFLEESVRTLVETEMLVGESGDYRLVQDVPTIQVPATVQAILAARIDRLPQEEKRLLQTAAVIGTEVPFTLLQAIAEMPKEALHRYLTHLQAAEFLYETSLFPERVYTFKHALTHEVAYGNMLQERRRVLHARIVEMLETLGGDRLADQVERLAHHAMRGEVWDKGVSYFRQSADRAVARSASREIVSCLEQALSALQHLPQSRQTHERAIDLRIALLPGLQPLGDLQRLLDYLREAERLAEALGDYARLGRVLSYMAFCVNAIGDSERSIAIGQRALEIATAHENFALQNESEALLGQAYSFQGNYHEGRDHLMKAVDALKGEWLYERFDRPAPTSVIARVFLAWCLAELGVFSEGMVRSEEGVRIAETISNPYGLVTASRMLGFVHLHKGDFSGAISVFETTLALCKDANIPVMMVQINAALGYAYALFGRITESLPLLEQAVEQAAYIRTIFRPLMAVYLGDAFRLAGRTLDAKIYAEQALEASKDRKQRGFQAWALRLLGNIFGHRNPPETDQAETHYQQALSLANELGMRPLQAHCHRGLGTLYRQTRQTEQARAELSLAIEMYRDMEMTFWLPEIEAVLSELEGKA